MAGPIWLKNGLFVNTETGVTRSLLPPEPVGSLTGGFLF
jgi:hypothetical protein